MRKNIKTMSSAVLGFIAGTLFLISCGGGNSTSPINEANASVPQTNDQMVCYGFYASITTGGYAFNCQKKSETGASTYNSMVDIFSDGWTVISAGATGNDKAILILCKGNNDHGINFGCEKCQSAWKVKPNTDNFSRNYAGKLPCSRCSGSGEIKRV